ncbi:MAG: glycosyltransferase [Caulobacteraceae bacterium]|nr:glycosyltransferase [Caulobacteraceae bacterium]
MDSAKEARLGAAPLWRPSTLRLADRPEISVVIPCYNAADTLGRALSSLAHQSWPAWEAIVVDDGSEDDSAGLAARRARRDPRVRVLRQSHHGAAAARNRGVAAASGTWLCFLDADDWLDRQAFARWLLTADRQAGAAVVVGRSVRVTEGGRAWPWPKRDLADAFGVFCSDCAITIHSALVKRSAVLAVGGFDASLRTSEDWDLWQRIARAGAAFAQTDQVVGYYRARAGSLSRDLGQAAADALEVMGRGHRPDLRVREAPAAYARGAPPDALAARRLYYLLWSGARDIAAGGEGLAAAALLPADIDTDFEPDSVGELMASGAADMLGLRPDQAGEAWVRMGPKLRRLLQAAHGDPARSRLVELSLAAAKAALAGGRAGDSDRLELGAAAIPPGLSEADDFAILQLHGGLRTIGSIALPMLGARSGADLRGAAVAQIGDLPLTRALLAARPWRRLTFWPAVLRSLLEVRGLGLRRGLAKPSRIAPVLRQRLRHSLRAGLKADVAARLRRLGQDDGASAHAQELARLRAAAKADLPDSPDAVPAPAGCQHWPGEAAERSAWDGFFSANRWDRESPYERLKFEDTLELTPLLPDGSGLELACAEGHFTERLAPRLGRLLATDISATALERARERCARLANVSFRRLDFVREPLAGRYDLIVCSEALYYAGPRMKATARKIAAALKPGGRLVMANACMISDEPDATGFDWGHDRGARTIGELFQSMRGLSLEGEIRRPLYRVQAFRRTGAAPAQAPLIERRPLEVTLEPAVARAVVWNGGTSRLQRLRAEASVEAPILMYHRISPAPTPGLERYCVHPDRFAEQIAWLRQRGCWGIAPEALLEALERNIPLPGRPVMLTFDDGYADFAEHAWPVLQRHDFTATLFVVAEAVGGRAQWDAGAGSPAPLMDWGTLAGLSAAGLRIESHGANHRPLTRLGVREIYREVLRGRALIENAVGRAPIAFCYPYGAHDRVSECVVRECGARLAFTTAAGVASLASNPLRLPRVEVSGRDDLESFVRKLGHWPTGPARALQTGD